MRSTMQRMDSDPFSANATSQLSSDFKSAVSTSPLEHRLHHKSRLDRAHSACLPSNKRPRNSDLNQAPQLNDVTPVWLEASHQERYLLLEDGDTGDVLMPLIYMKAVFEANYSRKLSSLKNRLVVIPSDQELSVGRPNTYLYWQWAFESPPNVKLLVRQELGEENTPQGHLRLILLPIVYNAMAAKENLRTLPLFIALQKAMRASTYDKLLRHPSTEPITPEQREQQRASSSNSDKGEGQPAGSTGASRDSSLDDGRRPARVFHGPRDLDATAMKYMYPFKEAEENDGSGKCPRLQHSVSHHDLGQTAAKVSGMVRTMMEQPGLAELREDLRNLKRRTEAQINSVSSELAIVKNCIMQLYNVLLPGKVPMQHLQPPPVMPHIPATQHFPTPQQALPQPSQLQRASGAHHAPPQHPAYPHLPSGHAQGGHGMPAVPARAFSPAQAMAVAPGQIHSSCSMESLVSGAGGVQEGSHESSTTGMAGRNLASMASQPSLQLGPEGANLAAMQGLQPYLQANGSQALPNNILQNHPSLQGALGGGGAALGLQMQQLSTSQHLPPNMPPRGAVENLAQSRFAHQAGAFPPQLADMGTPSMHMPPMPWGR